MLENRDSVVNVSIKERMRIKSLAIKLGISISSVFEHNESKFPSVAFIDGMIIGCCGKKKYIEKYCNVLTVKEFINKMKNKA